MNEAIERRITILRKIRVAPIDIVYGSGVPIVLATADFKVQPDDVVVFYAKQGDGPVYRCDGKAGVNILLFTPPSGFFRIGDNLLQVEINGNIIPFGITVICHDRISDVGSEETPEMVRPYVDQCQDILAKNQAISVKTPYVGENNHWFVYDLDSGKYVDSGVNAVGPRGEAFTFSDFTPEQLEALHGAPAILERSSTEFQASESGAVPPEGDWLPNVPNVTQGGYLWTRVTNIYNTGDPVICYSVARMGVNGEDGDPATLLDSEVVYQSANSGTVPPEGSWTEAIPAPEPGKYLWTRVTCTYNTGNPVVSYSVCRNGIDGSGSVSSVCGVYPDSEGNVMLTAANVGAVYSVCNVVPDEGGNVALTAENVGAITRSDLLDAIYPVGSIYLSVSETSPAEIFGGTWEKLRDRFLVGAGNKYSAGDTGGADSVALTDKQMPEHRHGIRYNVVYRQAVNSGGGVRNVVSGGTESMYTDFAGSGGAHENRPPYLAVNMWKRLY